MTENIFQLRDIKTWYYLLYLPGIIIIPGISPVELTKNMACGGNDWNTNHFCGK